MRYWLFCWVAGGCHIVPVLPPRAPIGEWLEKDGYAPVKVEGHCSGALGLIPGRQGLVAVSNENMIGATWAPVLGLAPILLDIERATPKVHNFLGPKEQRWVATSTIRNPARMY